MKNKAPRVLNFKFFKLGLSCLTLLFTLTASGQEDILRKCIDTLSNNDITNWNKIKSLKATSVSFYSANGYQTGIEDFGDPLIYTILYKRWPDKQKEELYSDSLHTNLTSEFFFIGNTRTIFMGNLPPIKVETDKTRAFDFYPVKIHNYILESKAIRSYGLTILPGKQTECYDIEIETKKEKHRFLINSKTFLLEAIFFPEMKIYWYISEYQIFDGYLIPTYILGVKDGVVYEWKKYKSFEFNTNIEQSKFEIP